MELLALKKKEFPISYNSTSIHPKIPTLNHYER